MFTGIVAGTAEVVALTEKTAFRTHVVRLPAGLLPGLATGASVGLSALMDVPYLFNPSVNLLSFLFSAGIGVVFGYFPARRAARMDPIDALRHE